MKASDVCKVVNNMSKQHDNENVRNVAKHLTQKWKTEYKKSKESQPESGVPSIETVRTWRDLYFYSRDAEQRKLSASAARISEHRQAITANKHLTQKVSQNFKKRPAARTSTAHTPHKSIRTMFSKAMPSTSATVQVTYTASNIKTKTIATSSGVMHVPRHLWNNKVNNK